MLNKLLKNLIHPYTTKTYQKLNIFLNNQDRFTVYLDTHDPLSKLIEHLKMNFPKKEFFAVKDRPYTFENNLKNDQQKNVSANSNQKVFIKSNTQISQQDDNDFKQMMDLSAFQLLVTGNTSLYEKIPNKQGKQSFRFGACIGVQVSQYFPTNNRNLPQKVANNIIQLAQMWPQNSSLSKNLSKKQTLYKQEKEEIAQQYKQFKQDVTDIYSSYISMVQFMKKGQIQQGRTRGLVTNLLALMSVNWVFLFAVTYGGYGWDVGQPLSYLIGLGVDLIAMMKIFQMDDAIQKTKKLDFLNFAIYTNLKSQLKMKQFQLSYFKRKM